MCLPILFSPRALALILISGVAPMAASGQSNTFNLAPAEPGLKEILGDTALSSGAAVHGVQIRIPDTAALRDQMSPSPLMLHLPEAWLTDDGACLQTGSIDGRYAGGADYSWQEAIAGPQIAGYDTQKWDYLKALEPDELAISLTRRACGEQSIWAGTQDQPIEISIASWRHDFAGVDVAVLVNGFASTRVTLDYGIGQTVECTEITAETRAAYNLACVVPFDDLTSGSDENVVTLVLRNYTRGIAGRATWLELYMPSAISG